MEKTKLLLPFHITIPRSRLIPELVSGIRDL